MMAIRKRSILSPAWNSRHAVSVALIALVLAATAKAQDAAACPQLPASVPLRWEIIQPQGLVFCRALRSDGSEAFAVTLSAQSPFRPSRGLREERAQINGQPNWWYRSELGGSSSQIVRETLIKMADERVAHVSILANTQEQLAQSQQWVSELRF